MTTIVRKAQLCPTMIVEASSVGWAPGMWPESTEVLTPDGKLHEFKRTTRIDNCGEFAGFIYKGEGGHALHVIND